MTSRSYGAWLGSSQLLFADQPADSAQTLVTNNIGLAHRDGFVSDLVIGDKEFKQVKGEVSILWL